MEMSCLHTSTRLYIHTVFYPGSPPRATAAKASVKRSSSSSVVYTDGVMRRPVTFGATMGVTMIRWRAKR